MTTVTIAKKETEWTIDIDGHAGSGPYGHDLVCACISLLTTMIAQTLLDNDKVITKLLNMASGKALFVFDIVNCQELEAELSTIVTGFKLLSQEYPQYVKIIL